jgi:CBS domain-containing protein
MTSIGKIMNECVVKVHPETTLAEAVKLFGEHHVGGAPVVADDGSVVGMISELQLLDVVFDSVARDTAVSEYMTREVVTVSPTDPLSQAATLFALYSFRRLPVVEGKTLVGMVTRRDLMNYSLQSGEFLTEPLVELIPELAELS